MAGYIMDRTIGAETDRAIVLGLFTGSQASASYVAPGANCLMTRHMSIGSNWSQLRIGILFAMNEYPNQAYNRGGGFLWGVSSGSRTPFDNTSDYTCVGLGMGHVYGGFFQYSDTVLNYQRDVTGSFFYPSAYSFRGWVTGTLGPYAGYSGGQFFMPNLGNTTKKRGVMILQISASNGRWAMSLAAPASSSLIAQGGNKDYTENDLITAMTSSGIAFPPTCSGLLLGTFGDTAQIPTSYPLDTAYFFWTGVPPMEIYSWYIYKVR